MLTSTRSLVRLFVAIAWAPFVVTACSEDRHPFVGTDAGRRDAAVIRVDGGEGRADGAMGGLDGGHLDAAPSDGGYMPADAATIADAGPTDASHAVTPDAGTEDAGARDAGGAADAGAMDAGANDAGPPDAGPQDAGHDAAVPTFHIAVDGHVTDAEWRCGVSYANSVASSWGPNTITRVRACADAINLYLAVEGTVETMNAMLIYVDAHFGDGGGVTISSLTDGSGDLDDAISAGITTPAGFLADWAWGTRDMDRRGSGFDARMGWREIRTNPANFIWHSADIAPVVCGSSQCETSIGLFTLGVTDVHQLRFFARIGNGTGTALSNQCVPEDMPSTPGMVTQLGALP